MATKLYVGGLPYSTNNDELAKAFSSYGTVVSAQVIIEKETGRSRGFGFVEMEDADANKAVASAQEGGMNGAQLGGRTLIVNVARPMEKREPRSGGGSYGGGSYSKRPSRDSY